MTKTIKIADKEFVLRNSNRSLLKFEETTGRSVMDMNPNFSDILTLFWCVLYGANRLTFNYEFEDFLDVLDEDETLVEQFTSYLHNKKEEVKDTKVKKKVVMK